MKIKHRVGIVIAASIATTSLFSLGGYLRNSQIFMPSEYKLIKKIVNKDDIDDVLKIIDVINHIIINKKPRVKDVEKIIPKYVAIPLPPLKFSHIE